MMFKTHLVFGFLISLAVATFLNLDEIWVFVGITTVAAIIPDIDTPFSKIGSKVRPLSWLFNLLFGHRGLLHTIWFPFFIYWIFAAFDQSFWGGAFFLGYISHLFADMLTIQGVYFFYPLTKVRINGFIKTGGALEWIFLIFCLAGIGFLLFI